jgi:GT2 family glycosyltransferase
MKLSHIICSRNRAAQLEVTLTKIDPTSPPRHDVELVLVDNASEDRTLEVMEAYAQQFPTVTRVLHTDRVGKCIALNAGVLASSGELIVFTDDDCYLGENFYDALLKDFDPAQYQYGTGQLLLFDPTDDKRIAIHAIAQKSIIAPYSLLPTGAIHGANMFFLRSVFKRIGNFSEDLGPGTQFHCEDIEFAARASLAGFTGVLLPSAIVYHHHRRKPGSAESDAALRGYDFGRGAYYAIGLSHGLNEFWRHWASLSWSNGPMSKALAAQLEREFRGAADYLKHYVEKNHSS